MIGCRAMSMGMRQKMQETQKIAIAHVKKLRIACKHVQYQKLNFLGISYSDQRLYFLQFFDPHCLQLRWSSC